MRASGNCLAFVSVLFAALLAAPASAELLGVVPEAPQIVFFGGDTLYDAELELFSVESNAVVIRLADSTVHLVYGTPGAGKTFSIEIWVDAAGQLVPEPGFEQLLVTGDVDLGALGFFSGTLLTGEAEAFGFRDATGTFDEYDFRFRVTGGQLAFLYDGYDAVVSLNSEASSFGGSFENSFGGRAKGTLGASPPLACEIELDKTCCIPPPPMPPQAFDCKDAKPIDTLTMIWNRDFAVDVVAHYGKLEDDVLGTIDNVVLGQEVGFSGFAGAGNDIEWEIFLAGTDTSVGKSTFHVSCSDDGMNGSEDCGLPQGDGKGGGDKDKDSGGSFLNDWLFEGMGGSGGALVCTMPETPETPTDETMCGVAPPIPPFNCQDAKDLIGLTMIWDMPLAVDVVAHNGDASMPEVGTETDVAQGQAVSFTGFSTNDVVWEIFSHATGEKLGESKFHLSCSDGEMNGTEDCGKAQGNGKDGGGDKDKDGGTVFLDFWALDGILGEGGALECTPPPPPDTDPDDLFQDACQVAGAPAPPHCTTKVQALMLRYVGGGCPEPSQNSQGGKASCSGDPGSSPVSIQITSKDPEKLTASPSSGIEEGDLVTFTHVDGELKASTKFDVTGSGSQSLEMHTSCSKPLNLGDRFGAFEVFAMQRKDEGTVTLGGTVEYQYTITNPTAEPLDVVALEDDKLGLLIPDEFDPFTLDPGASQTLFRKATLFEDTVNTAVVVGQQGQQCEAMDSVLATLLPPPPPPFDCSAAKDLVGLTMIWNGSETVDVVAHNGDSSKPTVGTVDNLLPRHEVSFSGFSTNDVFWEIFSSATGQKLGESKFHLSCSDRRMNGTEDCGKLQGNGKDDNSSNLNDWRLEGIQGEGGVFDCTSDEATAARLDVSSEECGLGFELAFILPGLTWLYGRRRRS